MAIKHQPYGLFPHFNSGMERRPYFVTAGSEAVLGCRFDRAVESALLSVSSGEEHRTIQGVLQQSDDCGHQYYRFVLPTEGLCGKVTYSFSGGGEASRSYSFELLHLQEAGYTGAACADDTAELLYSCREGTFSIVLSPSQHGVRCVFTHRLSVKTTITPARMEDPIGEGYLLKTEPNGAYLQYCGHTIARFPASLQLLLDGAGSARTLRFSLGIPGRSFYGFGEKFDAVDQAGKAPLNYVVEQFANQGDKTYLPVPFFFTEDGTAFLQTTTSRSQFDLSGASKTGAVEINAECDTDEALYGMVLSAGSPAQALEGYAAETGAPALPPVWAFGPWISSNGWNTQTEALEQVAAMNEHAVPATVMVLEAWSDEETFYIWNDAKYAPRADGSAFRYEDFSFPADGKWPNPKAFCDTLDRNNLKLVLWQIPAVKYTPHPETAQLPLDDAYAREQKLCIQNDDGTPYRITEMWFNNSLMPDFTNPEACSWWLEKRRYLVEQLGVAGFKTDGGEFLFNTEARLFDGQTGSAAHNAYPGAYEGAYHAFLEETRGKDQGVLFSRAGFAGAQKSPIHWAGDQVSTFSELEAQLKAGLSLGLSGVPFWGFDIGGFAGELPSAELYLRSAAFGAFAPVMQFHSEPRNGQYYMTDRKAWNNDRSPWNLASVQEDERILTVYRQFANLRMNLLPYLWQEARHCAKTARPMMAHLVYDFYETDLEAVRVIEDEYLLGRSLLVAPVIQEGATGRSVYLPTGSWRDFYTGELFSGGRMIKVECGLKRIPVFVKDHSAIPVNANAALILGSEGKDGAVSNRTDAYERLGFLLYGSPEEIHFQDDLGNDLTLTRGASGYVLSGRLNVSLSLMDITRSSENAGAAKVFGRSVPVTVIPQNTESNA